MLALGAALLRLADFQLRQYVHLPARGQACDFRAFGHAYRMWKFVL